MAKSKRHPLLTIAEAAKTAGVPETTIIDQLCMGTLKAVAPAQEATGLPGHSGFWTIGPAEIIEIIKSGAAAFHGFSGGQPVEIRFIGGLDCVRIEAESITALTAKHQTIFRDDTLLGVIAALLALYPKGKRPSGKELEKAAASLNSKISDDTIRAVLRRVKDFAPKLDG